LENRLQKSQNHVKLSRKGDTSMRWPSQHLRDRISQAVYAATSDSQINVVQIAELVQSECLSENVAFEDILSAVLDLAQSTGRPIVFEKPMSPELFEVPPPEHV
jgi:uncharacterized beta-barrel protein YwiB (DUF1934 family)